MITNLHIRNIGIIEDLEIDFNKGMNVLTGETGAGKTLIIDSLGIICGGRFSKEMIRKGENHSYVEICMYVPNDENAIDGNIIVAREIFSNGRNTCKINGRLVTVTELKKFMSNYIEIHGQNDNQQLLDSATHIKYLDSFSGEEIIKLKQDYKEKYIRYNEIKRALREKLKYGNKTCLSCRIYPLCHGGCSQGKMDRERETGCLKRYTDIDKIKIIQDRVEFLLEQFV